MHQPTLPVIQGDWCDDSNLQESLGPQLRTCRERLIHEKENKVHTSIAGTYAGSYTGQNLNSKDSLRATSGSERAHLSPSHAKETKYTSFRPKRCR